MPAALIRIEAIFIEGGAIKRIDSKWGIWTYKGKKMGYCTGRKIIIMEKYIAIGKH